MQCAICGAEFETKGGACKNARYCSDECRSTKRRNAYKTRVVIRPSVERIRELLSYNPKTGQFRWKVELGPRAPKGSKAGRIGHMGYRYIGIDRCVYRAHHVAWVHYYGEWPTYVEHKNRNRSDNRIDNLRLSTHAENTRNQTRHRDNLSGFKGVTRLTKQRRKQWLARIMVDGKTKRLGYFLTPEEAAHAYNAAAKKFHGEFASLNDLVPATT